MRAQPRRGYPHGHAMVAPHDRLLPEPAPRPRSAAVGHKRSKTKVGVRTSQRSALGTQWHGRRRVVETTTGMAAP